MGDMKQIPGLSEPGGRFTLVAHHRRSRFGPSSSPWRWSSPRRWGPGGATVSGWLAMPYIGGGWRGARAGLVRRLAAVAPDRPCHISLGTAGSAHGSRQYAPVMGVGRCWNGMPSTLATTDPPTPLHHGSCRGIVAD